MTSAYEHSPLQSIYSFSNSIGFVKSMSPSRCLYPVSASASGYRLPCFPPPEYHKHRSTVPILLTVALCRQLVSFLLILALFSSEGVKEQRGMCGAWELCVLCLQVNCSSELAMEGTLDLEGTETGLKVSRGLHTDQRRS